MPTIFARLIAGLALAGLGASSATANAPHTPFFLAEQVERLCPLAGGIGPLAGRLGEELPLAEYGPFENLGPVFAPFAIAETELTSWSGKLAALTYRSAHNDETDLMALQARVVNALESSGWRKLADNDVLKHRTYDNPALEKVLTDGAVSRRMVVELEASGAFMLRCGDHDQLRLDGDEQEERLAPGSPRPVVAGTMIEPRLPDSEVCATPEWRDAFAGVQSLDQLGPTLVARLPGGLPVPIAGRQAQRLNTWLHWIMIGSGQFDQDAIWQIEAAVAEPKDIGRDFRQFVTEAGSVVDADTRKDPVARCKTLLAFVVSQFSSDRNEAVRIGKVNAALEAAARAKGVAVD